MDRNLEEKINCILSCATKKTIVYQIYVLLSEKQKKNF